MVENRPLLTLVTHIFLLVGAVIVVFPIYIALVASTHEVQDILTTVQGWFGSAMIENYSTILISGKLSARGIPAWIMMWNSLIMALGIVIGKISISIISAYAIVYFRFPFRMFFFWMIFLTLMLPVEVRILPTYAVVANLGLLNSYPGLILPLIASATAPFLFDILLPLSRTNIAALFVILFIYGWNQYLWPLLVTTDESMATIVVGMQQMLYVQDNIPEWHLTMATAILAMILPLAVVILMQRQFVKGLVETEK